MALKKRYEIFIRDKWTCIFCGDYLRDEPHRLTLDHIIPKSRGGTSDMDNLVTCCIGCNRLKDDMQFPKYHKYHSPKTTSKE